MAVIKPFQCIRPNKETAKSVAALPYDVYNREEAKQEVLRTPMSFLAIDRAETQFDDNIGAYEPCIYEKAKELLENRIADKTFITEEQECYYLYELIMDGRSQTGIVACASLDDYDNNVIKKHENTREEKEIDRIMHVETCQAQTGPIFLAYRSQQVIHNLIEEVKKEEPLYAFTSEDGITHNIWKIDTKDKMETIQEAFSALDSLYIADGHHRAASAVLVGKRRRKANPSYTGKEEFNYFLSVLFPHDELMIMEYNRVVKDLNGLSEEEFMKAVKKFFYIEKIGDIPYKPTRKATFGMYLHGTWYCLTAKEELLFIKDCVDCLDVSLLQNYLLHPILGIDDPRTDKRIDFIGGIRGIKELERRANEDMEIAFAFYPTSIVELFSVADEGKLMPPKSTWFEPKLRSGLFIHRI